MGAPASGILAAIFIQYLEHTKIMNVLKKHHIIDYYRYVDGLFNIYNEDTTNIDNTLADFNSIHPNIHLLLRKKHKIN
jgi:nucleoside-specific outer membrane channel protein Tsx